MSEAFDVSADTRARLDQLYAQADTEPKRREFGGSPDELDHVGEATEMVEDLGSARAQAVIAIDLDGVLASWKHGSFSEIGPPISGAREFVKRLAEFATVIIYTCRCTPVLYENKDVAQLKCDVWDWLGRHGFSGIARVDTGGKPLADVYIDDRAVPCRPEDFGDAAYVSAISLSRALIATIQESQP